MTQVRPDQSMACSAAGIAFAAALLVTPAAAHAGFLDQLFGGGAPAPAQPAYEMPSPDAMSPDFDTPQPSPRARKRIVREEKPVLQKPTDIWHDKTLQYGDAVMMKDGVHIYLGPEGARHVAKDFVPVDDVANVPKREYAELTALDTTRNDPLKDGRQPDTLSSGRSSSVAVPISKGFRITDARGKSLRYVGP